MSCARKEHESTGSGHRRQAASGSCPLWISNVELPSEPSKKTLAQLNPENLPPVRESIVTMDLTMLDEFGTDKPYKKGGKGPVSHRTQTSKKDQP